MTALTAPVSYFATFFDNCRKALSAEPVSSWTEYLRECNKR